MVASPEPAPHAAATLPLSAAVAPEVTAQSLAVLSSMRLLAYRLAYELDSVTPSRPVYQTPCGSGGSWSITYVDLDHSGTRTVGDQIVMAAPGCSISVFGNGRAVATILDADAEEVLDARIVIEGGTLPVFGEWTPTVAGTLRMTADADSVWLRTEGTLVLTPGPLHSFRVANAVLRLEMDFGNNPPSQGVVGGLDIGFDTPAGGGRSLTLDTEGLVAGHSSLLEAAPGAIVLGGSDKSRLRISVGKGTDRGSTYLACDANGDGTYESTIAVTFMNILDQL